MFGIIIQPLIEEGGILLRGLLHVMTIPLLRSHGSGFLIIDQLLFVLQERNLVRLRIN